MTFIEKLTWAIGVCSNRNDELGLDLNLFLVNLFIVFFS